MLLADAPFRDGFLVPVSSLASSAEALLTYGTEMGDTTTGTTGRLVSTAVVPVLCSSRERVEK
jgi:hypothetical protein